LPLGMGEAGELLRASAFAWMGADAAQLPGWSADPHVVAFCQSGVVAAGLVGSLVILRRLYLSKPPMLALGSALAMAGALAGRWLTGLS